MPKFAAGWNMPGYMPDEASEFDDSDSAMAYIKEAAKQAVDDWDTSEDEALVTKAEIGFWKADENGEFGARLGEYHYFVQQQ